MTEVYKEFIYKRTYARWIEAEKRREHWDETVDRYKDFFLPKVPKKGVKDFLTAIEAIRSESNMPSMRSFYTAGKALERDSIAGYNCCYIAINTIKSFAELLYILMCGTGVGFSVERQVINNLPEIPGSFEDVETNIVFADSKKGWAEGFYSYIRCLFNGEFATYDLSKIRPKGAILKTFGGRACLTGDTIVYKDRKKSQSYNEVTIKDLYEMKNNLGKWRHLPNHFNKIKLRSLHEKSGVFYRNDLIDVIDNGVADVYEVTTKSGYKIKATMNHRFMDQTGNYKFLEEFKVGEDIAVNGSKEKKTGICIDCGCAISRRAKRCKPCFDEYQTKNTVNETTARQRKRCRDYRKEINFCERCGRTKIRLVVHHKDENPLNNSWQNLEVLCEDCHQKHHTSKRTFGKPYSHKYLSYDEIISIKFVGEERVYDLQMRGPNHNFVANGFVSHNSGPEPLDLLLKKTKQIIANAKGRKLNSLECHDICCFIAEAVVVGGVRRSSGISLSNLSDQRMRNAKAGEFWIANAHRSLANNSVVYTEKPDVPTFMSEWRSLIKSGTGERGIINRVSLDRTVELTNRRLTGYEWGLNPCGEIILRPNEFCNLSEVVCREGDTIDILLQKVRNAVILGCLQSTLTDFKFINYEFKRNCEEERLLGVSLTGLRDCKLLNEVNKEAKDLLLLMKHEAQDVAKEWSGILGINMAAGITCVKPSGCQTKDSMIITKGGILELGEVGDIKGSQWQEHQKLVYQHNGKITKSTKFYNNGYGKTLKIKTKYGSLLECTPNHKYQIFDGKKLRWKKSENLQIGDILPYTTGNYDGGYTITLNKISYDDLYHNIKKINQPKYLNKDLAWFLGLYNGDGSNHEKGIRISGDINKKDILNKAFKIIKEQFGIEGIIYERTKGNNADLYINSKAFLKWLEINNFLKEKSKNINIPIQIRQCKKEIIESYLDGYWNADGSKNYIGKNYCTVSYKMAKQLINVLRAIGRDCSLREMPPTKKSLGKNMRYWIQEKKGRCGNYMMDRYRKDDYINLDFAGLTHLYPDYIISIEESENNTYDIEVPDGNEYICESFISHNTVSQLVNSSSGLHTRFAPYYIRRVRVTATDPLCKFLIKKGLNNNPEVGDNPHNPNTYVFDFPIKSPENAIFNKDVSALDQLEYWKMLKTCWCEHNPSCTIFVNEDEWLEVGAWVYKNWDLIGGLSFLPKDNNIYPLAPYQEITEEEYKDLIKDFPEIDFNELDGFEDNDNSEGAREFACSGGSCELI